jgi:hypothetical protein
LENWSQNYKKKGEQDVEFNKKNEDELSELFKQQIQQRVDLLKKMSYYEWIEYNENNILFEYNGKKYDFFIYENVVNNFKINPTLNSDAVLRVSTDKASVGLMYSDIIKEKNYSFIFSVFTPNPNMIGEMWNLNSTTGTINSTSYYWLDSLTNRAVKKNFVVGNYEKKTKEGIYEGVIGLSYNISDIELDYSNKYYAFVKLSFLISMSVFIFVSSLILYYSTNKQDFYKPLILMVGSNAYIAYFMSTVEGVTNLATEQEKVKDINDGILSISFLVAVNIFIIETLKKVQQKYSLHNESAFLFCVALILLLMALYKKTAYNKIDDLREHRIEKQLMYNLSIFINVFILINYLVYISKETKMFERVMKRIF